MDERLKKQLDFALEIDKEKNIFRQTHLSGHGRNENDAEHAWHMAIMACFAIFLPSSHTSAVWLIPLNSSLIFPPVLNVVVYSPSPRYPANFG